MMLLLARQQDYLACTREEMMVEEVAHMKYNIFIWRMSLCGP